jgi:hypothetical protein
MVYRLLPVSYRLERMRTALKISLALVVAGFMFGCRSGDSYTVTKKVRVEYPDHSCCQETIMMEHAGVRLTMDGCVRWWGKSDRAPTMESLPAEGFDSDCSEAQVGETIHAIRDGDSLFYLFYDSKNKLAKEVLFKITAEEKL